MSIALQIKEKRISLGLTQKDFADALGYDKYGDRTLRRWENGESTPPPPALKTILNFATERPYAVENPNPDFKFIDLFAGIGGIRIPFQELGGKCVFTSEWDKFAQKTYQVNFGDLPSGDITQISSDDIPKFDILLAGFPCQPFSQAGLKKGFSDTRGTLFFEIERIIEQKRPQAIMLENVKQLRGHDKGKTIAVIKKHIETLGYSFDVEVLRAADFGVPQNRERLFIIGFDKEKFVIDEKYKFPYPIPPKSRTRLGDILELDVDAKYTISDKLYEGHLRRKKEHIMKGNGFGFSMVNADSPYTNTISARYYKDGSEILIDQGEGKNPRKLTPRECARLQGFDDKYIIPVSDTQAYKQFGNSVSVPVVKAVAEKMLQEMRTLKKRDEQCD
ncbi:MAG: DNA (cytosine-5-)-methyltransferase [Anaerovoracaceae bacterium]